MQSSGDYQDGDIVNIDETPLPYLLDDEKIYDIKGVKEVWAQADSQALTDKKQQCSLLYLLMVLIGFDLQSSLREKAFESLQRRKSFTPIV